MSSALKLRSPLLRKFLNNLYEASFLDYKEFKVRSILRILRDTHLVGSSENSVALIKPQDLNCHARYCWGRMKNTRQVIVFCIFLSFFSTGTYVYLHWAEIQAIHERWGYSGRKPPPPALFSSLHPGVRQTRTDTFILRINARKATRSSLSLSPHLLPRHFPFPPVVECTLFFLFSFSFLFFSLFLIALRFLTTAPPERRARLLIIIHVHIITFLCIIII